ncbi:MAG: hypothetical protein IPQ09_28945 [Myxococcales bacterium]|nr:hypothetical protein [Myxococcales bacterium]
MRRREKTLHFHLGGLGIRESALAAYMRPRLQLRVGGETYALTAHTPETLRARESLHIDGVAPSHFAENVSLSIQGVQSYHLTFAGHHGPPAPILHGIHIPSLDDRALLAAPATSVPDEDPAHLVSYVDCAVWCVFHHPSIMALDAAVATAVIDHIKRCDSFDALRKKVEDLAYISTPEDVEKGYAGWAEASYVRDATGAPVPLYDQVRRTSADGSPTFESVLRSPAAYEYSWQPDPSIKPTIDLVVTQTLERLHNDASMEAVGKYTTLEGTDAYQAPSALRGALGASKADVLLVDENVSRGGRRLNILKVEEREVELKVTNHLAIGVCVGASYFDDDGALTSTAFLGYVPATSYPSVTKAFTSASSEEYKLPLKDSAYAELWTVAGTLRAGDGQVRAPAGSTALDNYDVARNVAIILEIVLDALLPTWSLMAGTGGGEAAHTLSHTFFEALTEERYGLVIELIKAACGARLGKDKAFDHRERVVPAEGSALMPRPPRGRALVPRFARERRACSERAPLTGVLGLALALAPAPAGCGSTPAAEPSCSASAAAHYAELRASSRPLCDHQHLVAALTPRAASEAGVGTLRLPIRVTREESRAYCFRDDNGEPHSATLMRQDLTPVVSFSAGGPCIDARLPVGTYVLDVRHALARAGGQDATPDVIHTQLVAGGPDRREFRVSSNECEGCQLTSGDAWPQLAPGRYGYIGKYKGATLGGTCGVNGTGKDECVLQGDFTRASVEGYVAYGLTASARARPGSFVSARTSARAATSGRAPTGPS